MSKKALLLSKKAILLIPAFVILLPAGYAFAAVCPTCQAVNNQVQERVLEKAETREQKLTEWRNRLSDLKDKRKALILQKVSEIIENINSRWCTHFKNVLERLTAILSKISTRSDKLIENGVDVVTVEAAISDAEEAIASAEVAVEEQCAKAYVVDLGDENALRSSAQDEIALLRNDLKSTRDAVFAARDAVHKAIQALRQAWAKSRPGEASESAVGE